MAGIREGTARFRGGAWRHRAKLLFSGLGLIIVLLTGAGILLMRIGGNDERTTASAEVLPDIPPDNPVDWYGRGHPDDDPPECHPVTPVQAGPAKPWEASIPVGTYSSTNMTTGHVFTAVPLIGWNILGLTHYHNSSIVNS